MPAVVYVFCPACEWKSHLHDGGPSGRMMGVLTAGNAAEDEFDVHFRAEHMRALSPDKEAPHGG